MGAACRKLPLDEFDSFYDRPDDPEASTYFVGKKKQISDEKFTEVKIDEKNSVLVAKFENKYYAISDKCTHAGASLADSPVKDGRVRCSQHGACFDLETGDIEDFPGFDCIQTFKVETKRGNVFVKVNPAKLVHGIIRPMVRMAEESLRVVIIGSGACGYSCAQTLRQEGYTGRIIMITQDKYLPYDRTRLSKNLSLDFDDVKIRSATFYQDNDIEVLLNKTVRKLDIDNHLIYTKGSSKAQISYDNLLIAVGLKPRFYAPSVPGCDLKNIAVLHSLNDYLTICEKAMGKEVVMVGSSFVSMELAEMLSPVTKVIHLLSRSKVPYGLVLGEMTGMNILEVMLKKFNNIVFHPTDEVRQFLGNQSGEVTAVYTVKKQTIPCQFVIVGIGGLANTEFLEGSYVKLHPVDHSIMVNKYLETSAPQIFAGGDVVNFPFCLSSRDRASVTHWQMACLHGRVIALNMLGRELCMDDAVPYFWTNVSDVTIRYVGYGEGYDETIIYGNLEVSCFCTVYRRRRRLGAVCCVGCEHLAAELALLFELEKEWIIDIPPPILKKFPDPPINADAYHTIRNETHTKQHDLDVFKVAPLPLDSMEIDRRNKILRAQHRPFGFDVVVHHQEEDADKQYALELFNMRKEQFDRRRKDIMLHGRHHGNVSLSYPIPNILNANDTSEKPNQSVLPSPINPKLKRNPQNSDPQEPSTSKKLINPPYSGPQEPSTSKNMNKPPYSSPQQPSTSRKPIDPLNSGLQEPSASKEINNAINEPYSSPQEIMNLKKSINLSNPSPQVANPSKKKTSLLVSLPKELLTPKKLNPPNSGLQDYSTNNKATKQPNSSPQDPLISKIVTPIPLTPSPSKKFTNPPYLAPARPPAKKHSISPYSPEYSTSKKHQNPPQDKSSLTPKRPPHL